MSSFLQMRGKLYIFDPFHAEGYSAQPSTKIVQRGTVLRKATTEDGKWGQVLQYGGRSYRCKAVGNSALQVVDRLGLQLH